jgi:hypothetical protein
VWTCSSEKATTGQWIIGVVTFVALLLTHARDWDVWLFTAHPPKWAFPDAKEFEKSVSIGDEKTSVIDYTIQVPRDHKGKSSEVRWVTFAKARGWDLWKCTFGERIQFQSWVIGWTGINNLIVDYRFADMEELSGPHWKKEGMEWAKSKWPEGCEDSLPEAVDAPVVNKEMRVLKKLFPDKKELQGALKNSEWFHEGMPELQHRCWQHRALRRLLMILKGQRRQVIHETLLNSTLQVLVQTAMLFAVPLEGDELQAFLPPILLNIGSVAFGEAGRARLVFQKTTQYINLAKPIVEKLREEISKKPQGTEPDSPRTHEARAFVSEFDETKKYENQIFLQVAVSASLLVCAAAGVVITIRTNFEALYTTLVYFMGASGYVLSLLLKAYCAV